MVASLYPLEGGKQPVPRSEFIVRTMKGQRTPGRCRSQQGDPAKAASAQPCQGARLVLFCVSRGQFNFEGRPSAPSGSTRRTGQNIPAHGAHRA